MKVSRQNLYLIGALIIACVFGSGCVRAVSNGKLKDKMLACSASLEDSASVALSGHIDNNLEGGSLQTSFEEGAKGIFINDASLSSGDRLNAYKEYIKCIQTLKIPRHLHKKSK